MATTSSSRLASPHTTPTAHSLSPNRHDAASPKSPLTSPFLSAFSPSSPRLRSSSRHSSKVRHTSSHRSMTSSVVMPVKLSFRIESPPLVLYGKRTDSTGTLLSGLFTLEVLERTPFPMKTVHMAIIQEVKTIKPHSGHCSDCLNHKTELARWDVLTHPADLPMSSHVYPFSHLIPGSVPASTTNSVFSVSYYLTAVAVPDNTKHRILDPKSPGALYKFPNFVINHPLNIKRSIIPRPDRNSVRVFPPTKVTAQITLPSTIFPDSSFPFELLLEGVSLSKENTEHRQTRWRMRKLNWRIDEEARIKAFRCPLHLHVPLNKHASPSRSPSVSRSRRTNQSPHPSPSSEATTPLTRVTSNPPSPSLEPTDTPGPEEYFIENIHSVGAGELRTGWKTDFTGKGKIELLTEFNSLLSKTGCDIDDPTFGLRVAHVLVVEMIVAEEVTSNKTKQVMPTGAARVLRMQFTMNMTERSGLGIAWDDEVPPTYADVPNSPPEYQNVSELPTLEHVMLDPDEEGGNGIQARLN